MNKETSNLSADVYPTSMSTQIILKLIGPSNIGTMLGVICLICASVWLTAS